MRRWWALPRGTNAWYHAGCLLCYPLARLGFRLRVVGADRVPLTGGVLLAANHSSYLDIPMLGLGLPRQADFMGKVELFRHPASGWLYRRLGAFAVDRGQRAREGLKEGVRRLRAGRLVVIFPEGGRSDDGRLRNGLPGIGYMVAESGCPVVPAYIAGAARALPAGSARVRFTPITVVIGEPIDFSNEIGEDGSRERYQAISDTVMDRIRDLAHRIPAAAAAETTSPAAGREGHKNNAGKSG